MKKSSLRNWFSIFLPPGLLAASLFGGHLLKQQALYWGTPSLQFIPWWKLSWQAILSSEWPLWNPYLGMGAPLLANYQSGLFYPPHWVYFLFYLLGGTPMMAWGVALMVSAHLIWASLGMSFLVRRLGGTQLAQQVAGLAFGFCAYLIARAGFLSINATAAWLPWIIWSLTPSPRDLKNVLRVGVTRKGWISSVLFSMQWLAGHAQISWYTLILAFLWVGFWLIIGHSFDHHGNTSILFKARIQERIRCLSVAWINLILVLSISFGLCAIQLIPTAEYLWLSQRGSATEAEWAMTYSFWPWHLLTFLAADFFGNPATGDYWGYANYWEDAVYLGLFPLVLSVYMGVVAWRKKLRNIDDGEDGVGKALLSVQLSRFSWGLFLVALILALGKNLPVFPWLYRNVPTFDLFQAPTRFMIWGEFSLSLMAGLGIDRIKRPMQRSLYWTRLATAGSFAVLLGAVLTQRLLPDVHPTFIRSFIRLGWLGVAIGLLILSQPTSANQSRSADRCVMFGRFESKKVWSFAVIGLLILDLYLAGRGLNPGIPTRFYASYLQNQSDHIHRIYMPADKEYELKFERYFRFDRFQTQESWFHLRTSWLPNLPILDSIGSVNNFDPILPAHFVAWMERLETLPEEVKEVWLDWMDVSHVVDVEAAGSNLSERPPRGNAQRFWWFPCAQIVPDAQSMLEVLSGSPSLENLYLMDLVGQEGKGFGICSSVEPGKVMLVEEGFNHVSFKVISSSPGFVMIADTWYPGWEAQIDGQTAQIYRANYLFRAVYLESGEHFVEMRYQPASFQLGALVSLLTLFLFAWLNMAKFRSRKKS